MAAEGLTTEQILARTEYAAECLLAALNEAVGQAVRSPLRAATARQVIEAVLLCNLRLQDIVEALKDELQSDGVLVVILDDEKAHAVTMSGLAIADELQDLAARGAPAKESYCQYTVGVHNTFVVCDARLEPVLKDHPHSDRVRGYLGGVLTVRDQRIGALCAISEEPKEWTPQQQGCITEAAAEVSAILERALAEHLNRRKTPGSAPGAERRRG